VPLRSSLAETIKALGAEMPRMIGPVTADRWEREIRRQLAEQLPPDWTVVCNVAWALRSDTGFVRDGQCDFVVLAPGLGMVILEVKGSRSVRVGDDGTWYRTEANRRTGLAGNEVAIEEAPPEQACRNMYALVEITRRELSLERFPGAYAFVVAYPNGLVRGRLDLYDATTVIDRDQIPQLHGRLRAALEARGPARTGAEFTVDLARRTAATLSNSRFIIQPADTPLDFKEDIRDIDELTRHQFAALRGAFELPSAAIIGPAGSGKTMLAMWKLAALIEEGKRAIYVCFNVALAERLRIENAAMASSITSVDKLFTRFVGARTGELSDRYFIEELPQQVLDRSADMKADEKYEAIVVDEGQDFGDMRVIALLDLLVGGGQWLFFADWHQDVYRAGNSGALGAEVTFRLYHNCRNTERINSATNQYCSHSISSMPGVPVGVVPLVARCASYRVMAARAWELARELSPDGGAVFLSPYRLANSCVDGVRKGHGLELTEDIRRLGTPGCVFYSTIKSFKGLEAQHIILLHADIPDKSQAFAAEDLYVACTRATGRLSILVSTDEAIDWFTRNIS
jgi:hypothetical protein